ncbi:MAG: hypothetical protein KAQ91_07460 [Methylococcales bacterium]|nr:hypothetical protein [Methylococcales bacterium]
MKLLPNIIFILWFIFFTLSANADNKYISQSGLGSTIPISLANPQLLIDKALPGDTVTIKPAIYLKGLRINKSITLNLKGVYLWGVSGSKSILNIDHPGGPVVINDFVGQGERAGAVIGNLAGIKITGRHFDVTINRADISGSVMGILTDNKGGVLRIIDSYIHDTGSLDIKTNLSHIVYAGKIDEIHLLNSRLERSHARGHLFKSRAHISIIRNSQLLGDNSRHSRLIDLPCGGELIVSKSKLVQSPTADNLDLIGLGHEQCGVGNSIKVSINNSSVTATQQGSILYSTRRHTPINIQFIDKGDNTFVGVTIP